MKPRFLMTKSAAGHTLPSGLKPAGFSLVEMVVSLGVLSFTCVGMLGMTASCFDQFRRVIERSGVSTIAQNLINEVQQSDLAALKAADPGIRYYDEQTRELADPGKAVYRARMAVTPSAGYPAGNPANPFLTRITVQVASNNGPQPVAGPDGLWVDSPKQRIFTEVALLGPGR
jgi:uncharacterized protein (TIGR02598 family)